MELFSSSTIKHHHQIQFFSRSAPSPKPDPGYAPDSDRGFNACSLLFCVGARPMTHNPSTKPFKVANSILWSLQRGCQALPLADGKVSKSLDETFTKCKLLRTHTFHQFSALSRLLPISLNLRSKTAAMISSRVTPSRSTFSIY